MYTHTHVCVCIYIYIYLYKIVLVHLGCLNKNTRDQAAYSQELLIVLESGSLSSEYKCVWVGALFQVADFSLLPHVAEG